VPCSYEHLAAETHLFFIVQTGDALGAFLGAGQRWQQECRQNGDDGNYDQQFNQRERLVSENGLKYCFALLCRNPTQIGMARCTVRASKAGYRLGRDSCDFSVQVVHEDFAQPVLLRQSRPLLGIISRRTDGSVGAHVCPGGFKKDSGSENSPELTPANLARI
jgi:hypothetical protein